MVCLTFHQHLHQYPMGTARSRRARVTRSIMGFHHSVGKTVPIPITPQHGQVVQGLHPKTQRMGNALNHTAWVEGWMHSHRAVDSTKQRNSVSTNQLMRRQPASASNPQGLRRLAPSAPCGEDAQPTALLYATSTLEGPRSWTRSTRHGCYRLFGPCGPSITLCSSACS